MDALYFPHLTLPGRSWINPNLLYFDRLSLIAPWRGGDRHIFDRPTRDLIDANLVQPLDPYDYAHAESDQNVVEHIIRLAESDPGIDRTASIHLGKIAHTRIPRELVNYGLLWEATDHSWLEGPQWVVDRIMSAIAVRMLADPDKNLALVTDELQAQSVLTEGDSRTQRRRERRLEAIMTLLPVAPNVPIEKLLKFREAHARELREFRSFVESLAFRSADADERDEDFRPRLRQATEHRNHLIGELQTIQSRSSPVAIAISAAAVLAPALEGSRYSLAASALGMGYLLFQHNRAMAERNKIISDRMVYAATAVSHFRPTRTEDILRY